MYNLSVHKTKSVGEALEKIGGKKYYLFHHTVQISIQSRKLLQKLKARLRAAEKRTVPDLIDEITNTFESISSEECEAYFRCCINQMKKVRREYLAKLRKEKNGQLDMKALYLNLTVTSSQK